MRPRLGLFGVPVGMALLIGTIEFVGPHEERGSRIAGTVVRVAYVAWSLWLVALGIALIA